ncbi:hypothetical protein DEO72_LG11g1233 [Vigna unguiculata]|uniref:Uncharacterized protein n=1 Tax=Vigna unguiculata TaxID=3917 RepID=A0A4D6NNK4_VIGUN|nr:hypothetical protein DEO72_LG11g1233 [Vigna unguiculata]
MVATLQRRPRSTFFQHRNVSFPRPERRPCPAQKTTFYTASCALPASVRVRCASETGKRGSDAVSELPRLQERWLSSRP